MTFSFLQVCFVKFFKKVVRLSKNNINSRLKSNFKKIMEKIDGI